MIKSDAITVAFHRLTISNVNGTGIFDRERIKKIIENGLCALQVESLDEKKHCFEHYHLYVNEIQKDADCIYCRISDSRYGYPEDIYFARSDRAIATSIDDVRSKRFFINLDFSSPGYVLLANQYIGGYGCYMAIEKALRKILLDAGYKLNSTAIVNKGEIKEYFEKGGIKAFEVTRFEPQADIADDNVFCKKCTVTLSPTTRSKSDHAKFYDRIQRIFMNGKIIRPQHEIAKQMVAESQNSAFVANDGVDGINLEQYRVKIYSKNGTFDLVNQDGTMATKYHIDNCQRDADGNPNFEDIKNKTNTIMAKIKDGIE